MDSYLVQQPKIQVASKYERRVDTRSYDDKKKLFEGVSIIILIICNNPHHPRKLASGIPYEKNIAKWKQ